MTEELKDRILLCRDCGRKFTFDVYEQKLYGQKDWQDPIRCKNCQRHKKIRNLALKDGVSISDQNVHEARCADCGRKLLLTKDVREGEKEYCRECWLKIKGV